ncbi:hypothetical protein [Flavobacterium beibuense]|uniref:hypothetical protein n=1 Tax=Flavobacterium beibuense TaxID=657326 RepID=UPI003A92A450
MGIIENDIEVKDAENVNLEVVKPYNDEQIDAHAAKIGGRRFLKEIYVDTDDGYRYIYLVKRPSRSVIDAVAEKGKKEDVNGITKLMFGCILEGDMKALDNDASIYQVLIQKISELSRNAKAELKKI